LVRLEPAAVRADVVANGTVVEPFDLHRQNVRTPRSALRRYWCTIYLGCARARGDGCVRSCSACARCRQQTRYAPHAHMSQAL
jgi:hypothetical protein